ncbi:putative membrane protein SirB2 [Biostraticola tofi]|uniref:Putative membrane protein SirB2 n=1 Tax=Biostraticola tofi TaxID=466109 RepID=A0A4R3Z3H6_9GAMM|nr:putative membrane protein SirB2 [Biostraticola tofi]
MNGFHWDVAPHETERTRRKRVMYTYIAVKYIHFATIWITITLLVLRFYWRWQAHPMLSKRWVRIVPHLNDTLLLITGISLIFITGISPFSPYGSWLLEKLAIVVVYILLGFVALGNGARREKIRWLAFICGVTCFYVIYRLATTKHPLLTGFL